MPENIRFFITEKPGGLLPQPELDLCIVNADATLGDFLLSLGAFADARLAPCRGCDGCCHERAPLIAADIPALSALLPPSPYPAHSVCAAFAMLSLHENGAVDITLKRDISGACSFLDTAGKFCREHLSRPFVCRSHFCLPRSMRFEKLRQAVINMGEDALVRLLLDEEAAGAPPLTARKPLSALIRAEDYPQNAHSGHNLDQILIRDSVDAALWRLLCAG